MRNTANSHHATTTTTSTSIGTTITLTTLPHHHYYEVFRETETDCRVLSFVVSEQVHIVGDSSLEVADSYIYIWILNRTHMCACLHASVRNCVRPSIHMCVCRMCRPEPAHSRRYADAHFYTHNTKLYNSIHTHIYTGKWRSFHTQQPDRLPMYFLPTILSVSCCIRYFPANY